MNAFIFLIILFSSTFHLPAAEPNCPVNQCGHGGPKIQFPFQVKGLQLQQHCRPGQPGFEVVCKDNTTLIHFPSYGDLVVRSISYDDKRLNLLDPKNCVHGVFLNLNLSVTPFRYFYGVKDYTYLNCSSALASSFPEVPCLSSSGHHVYTVEPSLALPNSCRKVKTVAIPFQYSPYVSDNSFGLGLSWGNGLPGSDDGCGFKYKTGRSPDKDFDLVNRNAEGNFPASESMYPLAPAADRGLLECHIDYLACPMVEVLSISIFLFAMVVITVTVIKIYHSKKIRFQDEEKNPFEVEKLLEA